MAQIEEEKPQTFHYLLSGIQLEFDTFDLGNEAVLSKTYVHLMAHPVLAFTQPEGHGHHPGPWQVVEAAPGMSSIDLYAVLSITHSSTDARAPHDRASWITLLMRFSTDTAVTITLASTGDVETLRGGGVRARLLEPIRRLHEGTTISREAAQWLRDNWHSSLHLSEQESLMFALGAIYHSHRSTEPLGLVSVWAALERLFSSNAAELKFRVCANIAAYLEGPGEARYGLFKYLSKLYDARSAAAHGSEIKRPAAYMDSVSIASQVVMRIIDLGKVPTKDELEKELFWSTERRG
jgi:hypothetical protein